MNEGLPGDGIPLFKEKGAEELKKLLIDYNNTKGLWEKPGRDPEFIIWLKEVGIYTLKREIRDFEEENLLVGLLLTCEMIYKGARKK